MGEACTFFQTPITGGNVSLYNETLGEAVYPTPVVGIVGLMKTAAPVTIDFKQYGRAIVLLGGLGQCDETQFGSSQYAKVILKQLWGMPPGLDMEYEKRVQAAARDIAQARLAGSAHDVSDGGLAVALAECCFGPNGVGAVIDIDTGMRPEFLLFHEGPSRILISTAQPDQVARIARKHNIQAPVIGATMKGGLKIRRRGRVLLDCDLRGLRGAWEEAMEKALEG
jgi:phosphoribosylformylglycinamidine synthase